KDYSDENLCAAYEIDLPCTENENYKPYCVLTVYEKLCDKLSNRIKANEQEKLLSDIEIPLANVLAKMENIGFDVDRQGIEDYGKVLSSQIESLKSEIYQNAGEEFNINSPKQLGKVLFEDLQLPCKKKTKSGYSTNADVLESLRYQHPIVDMVLNYRTLAKLNSTYCEGLLKVIGDDGRIHSSFNQTETRTGRISSTEPNLQNIPVRTELGREMRKFFCAKDGWTLVDADYSQIELRVLAHISHDKNMIESFKNNDDIHAITASQVFNMPLDMVTPIMRSRAKAVNFGIVYGIGAFSLAKDIGVSNKEASQYIKNYLAHYSGVDEYMKNVVEKAKQDGYVETMFGRRRYLPELTSGKAMLRKFGERVARNMPIQGTAADIIKIAMIRVNDRLKKEGLQSRLILQIHDELIVEAPIDESLYVAKLLQEEMENAVALDVPLTADAAVGKTWYDAKG
ncbi:MAG: DNA polymerase I, partial [Ruminococcus bromii]|nr:DNA polymerase I [Ruminococcus bromii]